MIPVADLCQYGVSENCDYWDASLFFPFCFHSSVICVRVRERGSKGGREGMWEEKREGERELESLRLFT